MSGARFVGSIGLAVVCAAMFGVAGCGGSSEGSAGDATKVTVMYAGPKDDQGYHQGAVDVAEAIKEAFGDDVVITHADNVPYTGKSGQVAQQLVNTGTDVILDTANYGEPVYDVCLDNPDDVVCLIALPLVLAGQGELAPNMAGFYGEWWKAQFVMGAAAGLMTETDVIGAINPLRIPLTNSFMNSFVLGCQYTNPECRMRVITVNTYFDPPAASQAANTLADAGADVITGWVNDGSPCVAAEERGLLAVGQYFDYSSSCPNASIGTVAWSGDEWEQWFVDQVANVRDGTFESKQGGKVHRIPFGEGTNAVLNEKNLPADVLAEVEQIAAQVESGELDPFAGPILDTAGKTRVPKGEKFDLANPADAHPSLADGGVIYGWNWLVDGIVGG